MSTVKLKLPYKLSVVFILVPYVALKIFFENSNILLTMNAEGFPGKPWSVPTHWIDIMITKE